MKVAGYIGVAAAILAALYALLLGEHAFPLGLYSVAMAVLSAAAFGLACLLLVILTSKNLAEPAKRSAGAIVGCVLVLLGTSICVTALEARGHPRAYASTIAGVFLGGLLLAILGASLVLMARKATENPHESVIDKGIKGTDGNGTNLSARRRPSPLPPSDADGSGLRDSQR